MSLDKVKNVGSPIYSQNLIIDDEQSEEGEFEKTNHIFILNSKINELNIVIQKMSLQYQQKLTEQKNIIESIKREYQSRSEALGQEYQKVQTIAEAEKQAKNIIAKQLKSTKQVLQQLKMMLEMPKEASDQQLKQHLVNINDRNKQLQARNCQLENQTESIGIMHQEEQEKLIAQFEVKAKRQNERHQAKINQLQTEKHKHLLQITTYKKTIEEQKKKIQMLTAIEGDYRKSLRAVEQLQSSQTKLEAELNSLKVKEQIFTITKEKYQQTKLTMDEYVEQMTFKIGLQQKKLEIETARLNEERTRNKNLDSMFCTSRQQLRLAEEKIACLQQNLQELKQKNSMLEIYREKQKTSVNIINELEDKNRKLGGEILRLKQERDEKKNQYDKIQQEKTKLEKNINKQCIEIEQLRKHNLQLNLKTRHQGELIDQMKQQINKNKQQLTEAKLQLQQAQLQFRQVLKEQQVRKETSCESKPTLKQVIGYPQREMWQQINQNIVKHYQQLLIEEDRTRLELQQQLQSSRTNINQLKQRLAQTSSELNELQQERQLLINQNKRLLDSIGAISKSHQQRVTDFKQKFTQLLPVSPHKHTLRHFKSQKHLSISNCYNFTQHTQINQNNDSHTPELKIDRSESSSVENVFKKLVKYSSTDNFTEKYTRQGVQGRSSELSESIRVLRDRNSNMRMRLNI